MIIKHIGQTPKIYYFTYSFCFHFVSVTYEYKLYQCECDLYMHAECLYARDYKYIEYCRDYLSTSYYSQKK